MSPVQHFVSGFRWRSSWGNRLGRARAPAGDYTIDEPEGTRRCSEVHEVALFTVDEMLASFSAAGLAVRHDPAGLPGRGRYVATLA